MAVQALEVVTATAAHSVPTPTQTRTGPRSLILQSVGEFKTVLLSATIVSKAEIPEFPYISDPAQPNRQETEAPPGGPRETSCNFCFARTITRRASVSEANAKDSNKATILETHRCQASLAVRPSWLVRLLFPRGPSNNVRPAMYSPALCLTSTSLLLPIHVSV